MTAKLKEYYSKKIDILTDLEMRARDAIQMELLEGIIKTEKESKYFSAYENAMNELTELYDKINQE